MLYALMPKRDSDSFAIAIKTLVACSSIVPDTLIDSEIVRKASTYAVISIAPFVLFFSAFSKGVSLLVFMSCFLAGSFGLSDRFENTAASCILSYLTRGLRDNWPV